MPKFFQPVKAKRTHSRHSLYPIWYMMHYRCKNPNSKDFPNYGGRGIQVCERWADLMVFASDMGAKPSPAHTLERVNNNGNYEPGNCVWATRSAQNFNRRKYGKKNLTNPSA